MNTFIKIALCTILLLPLTANAKERVLVFAASSLSDVLTEISTVYNNSGGNVVFSFAGSGTLARQIENGAPANIFISANTDWINYLNDKKLLKQNSTFNIASNSLVLIAKSDYLGSATLSVSCSFFNELTGSKIVLGATESVPAGIYAKQAITALDMWPRMQQHVAEVDNVRTALSLVSRGEALFGVVYETDALADDNVKILETLDRSTYSKITYPMAIIKENDNAATTKFYNFLKSDDAKNIFKKHGFIVD